jgi:transposase
VCGKDGTGMKKKTKKQTKQTIEQFAALREREAESLVIGIDLGDRHSHYCVRTRGGEAIVEGTVETKPAKIVEWLEGLKRQRIVVETGTHSRWIAELMELMGHEVIVGNSRKLKLITQNDQKSDKVDARLLSKMGAVSRDWLYPVYQRRAETHRDLMMVRSRDLLVETRTSLINHVRGMAKSYGCRLPVCGAEAFAEVAAKEMPAALKGALGGVLALLAEVDEQLYGYDCQVKHACEAKYREQTRWLLQVGGVGPVTALTYVLTIEDAERFEDSRDVGAYLGLVAKRRQSGKEDPQLGISKAGDEMLRKLLVNCAHHILGHLGADSDLRRWGMRLLEAGQRAGKKGARKRAAAAVARKLAVILHVLWKHQREYEPLRMIAKAVAPAA